MLKKELKKEEAPEVEAPVEAKEEKKEVKSPAWDAFLAKYEKENPVKFAIKKARGEFDKVPANFKG